MATLNVFELTNEELNKSKKTTAKESVKKTSKKVIKESAKKISKKSRKVEKLTKKIPYNKIKLESLRFVMEADENDEIIGYQYVSLGKMTDFIKKGELPNDAWEKSKGEYGRVKDAKKIIDPRKE